MRCRFVLVRERDEMAWPGLWACPYDHSICSSSCSSSANGLHAARIPFHSRFVLWFIASPCGHSYSATKIPRGSAILFLYVVGYNTLPTSQIAILADLPLPHESSSSSSSSSLIFRPCRPLPGRLVNISLTLTILRESPPRRRLCESAGSPSPEVCVSILFVPFPHRSAAPASSTAFGPSVCLLKYLGNMSKKRGSDGEFGTEDLRRMAMKHASLKQEYNELQRETRAMKKRLQRAKLKKGNLLAEVRFLRKRHRLLTKRGSQFNEGSPSQKQTVLAQAEYAMPLKTSLTAQAIPYEYEYTTTGTSSDEDGIPQAARKDSSSSMEFTHSPETKPLVTKEFQVFWEPLRTAASAGREEAPTMTETAKRKPPTSVVESDLNLSIFKDVPNGFLLPNRTGKRKISWQDQMALKV